MTCLGVYTYTAAQLCIAFHPLGGVPGTRFLVEGFFFYVADACFFLSWAKLICDVISHANTGHVSNMIKDQIMEYIDKETDFAPLNAVKECSQGRKEFGIKDMI